MGAAVYSKEKRSLYERFVDAYVEKNSGFEKSRETVVRDAQTAWKAVREDQTKANGFIEEVKEWKSQQVGGSLWFRSVSSSDSGPSRAETVTDAAEPNDIEVLPEVSNSCSTATDAEQEEDSKGAPPSATTTRDSRRFVEDFLQKIEVNSAKRLTADVKDQASFMNELAEYVRVRARFENSRTTYEGNIDSGVAWARRKSSIKTNIDIVEGVGTKLGVLLGDSCHKGFLYERPWTTEPTFCAE